MLPLPCPPAGTHLLLKYNVTILTADGNVVLDAKRVEHDLYRSSMGGDRYRWTTDQYTYPHPFSPTTTLAYEIPESSSVLVIVFNVLGEVVDTVVNEVQPAGHYDVTWNADSTIASGVYFYKIIAGEYTATKKMMLLR